MKKSASAAELRAIDLLIRERVEETLDEGHGECWMRDPHVAAIVANALTYFDNERYLLSAWCVMPNHVHVVFNAWDRIDQIIGSWKSYTSKEANKLVRREGEFWQQDYFDRSIRNRTEFDRTVRYVLENPMQSDLHDWPWVRSYPERFESSGGTPDDCGRDARSPLRNPSAS